MTLDLDRLLAPVSADDPTGPDLAYDPQRHAIEQAFDAPVSIDANGEAGAEGETDWRRIVDAIDAQSARTKDVWLAVYLCRAGARAGVLDLVGTGAAYLAGLIERYWDAVHPRLEEYGVEGRTGACDTLVHFAAFTGPLRHVALLDHPRHGRFTGADLHRFQQHGEAEPGYGALRATLDEPESLERLAAAAARLDTIAAHFHAIDAALAQRAGAGAGTSFAPLHAAVAEIAAAARGFLPAAPVDAAEHGAAEDAVAVATRGVGGTVRSRDDVVRAIDLAIDYYRRAEPHSPVPLLLGRAREWVHRDFMEVLEDIAPNALGDARHLLHFRGGAG